MLSCFLKDNSGATAIEYAFIASGISIAISVVVTQVGSGLVGIFTTVENSF